MSDKTSEVNSLCEKHGWAFQEPYTLALKLIVARRRKGMNEIQHYFWMSQATDSQKAEAIGDALAIMEVSK